MQMTSAAINSGAAEKFLTQRQRPACSELEGSRTRRIRRHLRRPPITVYKDTDWSRVWSLS